MVTLSLRRYLFNNYKKESPPSAVAVAVVSFLPQESLHDREDCPFHFSLEQRTLQRFFFPPIKKERLVREWLFIAAVTFVIHDVSIMSVHISPHCH